MARISDMKFVTQRELPKVRIINRLIYETSANVIQMALIQPVIKGDVLELTAPSMPKFTVSRVMIKMTYY